MSLVKFLSDETIMDIGVDLEGHRVILKAQSPITAIASLVESGFLLLNEHNNKVMSDFSGHKYIYYMDEDNYQYIITDDQDDIYYEQLSAPKASLEEIKALKISELEFEKEQAIANGISITFNNGTSGMFSLNMQDQISLTALRVLAEQKEDKNEPSIPWHTSDDATSCRYFSPEEIIEITDAAVSHITYHNVFFRDLRAYINSLYNEEDIEKITYDLSSLPTEARSKVFTDLLD